VPREEARCKRAPLSSSPNPGTQALRNECRNSSPPSRQGLAGRGGFAKPHLPKICRRPLFWSGPIQLPPSARERLHPALVFSVAGAELCSGGYAGTGRILTSLRTQQVEVHGIAWRRRPHQCGEALPPRPGRPVAGGRSQAAAKEREGWRPRHRHPVGGRGLHRCGGRPGRGRGIRTAAGRGGKRKPVLPHFPRGK
jgi:hypothetical protein